MIMSTVSRTQASLIGLTVVVVLILLFTLRLFYQSSNKGGVPNAIKGDVTNDCEKWMKSCEEHCIHKSDTPIPKHIHFISLNRPFSFMEWLAVVAARKQIRPNKITIYTDGQQDSCWWQRILPYIEHQVILSMPGTSFLNDVPIKLLSHMSDFLCVFVVYHNGGIYMDTDILSLKSFDSLLHHQVVVSEECHGKGRVNGALLMGQKHSCVICKFAHLSCRKFNGGWITHAVSALTYFMGSFDKRKEGVLILPWRKGFHLLCWNGKGINQLYNTDVKDLTDFNMSDVYSVHLFHHMTEGRLHSTIYSYEWIQTSPSLLAHAIRGSLPPNFSKGHLDESACMELPLPDL